GVRRGFSWIDLSNGMRLIARVDDFEHSAVFQCDGSHHGPSSNGEDNFTASFLPFYMTNPGKAVVDILDSVEYCGNRGVVEQIKSECIGVYRIEINGNATATPLNSFERHFGLCGQGNRVAE